MLILHFNLRVWARLFFSTILCWSVGSAGTVHLPEVAREVPLRVVSQQAQPGGVLTGRFLTGANIC